jgi:hypothetical protein
MIYGYARVSTDGQSVAAQVAGLQAAGAGKVFRETCRSRTTHRADVCAPLVLVLTLTACSRTDPGISREKAEAVLKAYDYTEIELQAAPDGWSGTAIPASGGYRMSITVDRNGMMQLQPCACGGKVPAAR